MCNAFSKATLLDSNSSLLRFVTAESTHRSVLSLKSEVEVFTTTDISSIEELNEVFTSTNSSLKEVRPSDPFCNFFVLAFKTELNLGKKTFKEIK